MILLIEIFIDPPKIYNDVKNTSILFNFEFSARLNSIYLGDPHLFYLFVCKI